MESDDSSSDSEDLTIESCEYLEYDANPDEEDLPILQVGDEVTGLLPFFIFPRSENSPHKVCMYQVKTTGKRTVQLVDTVGLDSVEIMEDTSKNSLSPKVEPSAAEDEASTSATIHSSSIESTSVCHSDSDQKEIDKTDSVKIMGDTSKKGESSAAKDELSTSTNVQGSSLDASCASVNSNNASGDVCIEPGGTIKVEPDNNRIQSKNSSADNVQPASNCDQDECIAKQTEAFDSNDIPQKIDTSVWLGESNPEIEHSIILNSSLFKTSNETKHQKLTPLLELMNVVEDFHSSNEKERNTAVNGLQSIEQLSHNKNASCNIASSKARGNACDGLVHKPGTAKMGPIKRTVDNTPGDNAQKKIRYRT